MVSIIQFHELPVRDYVKKTEKEVTWESKQIAVIEYQSVNKLSTQDLILKIVMLVAKIFSFNQLMKIKEFKNQWNQLASKTFLVEKSTIVRRVLALTTIPSNEIVKAKEVEIETQKMMRAWLNKPL